MAGVVVAGGDGRVEVRKIRLRIDGGKRALSRFGRSIDRVDDGPP